MKITKHSTCVHAHRHVHIFFFPRPALKAPLSRHLSTRKEPTFRSEERRNEFLKQAARPWRLCRHLFPPSGRRLLKSVGARTTCHFLFKAEALLTSFEPSFWYACVGVSRLAGHSRSAVLFLFLFLALFFSPPLLYNSLRFSLLLFSLSIPLSNFFHSFLTPCLTHAKENRT